MKHAISAATFLLATMAAPAHAQVSGIDTTTSPETDAGIDIAPPAVETGAALIIDSQLPPDDALDVEAQGDADLDSPDVDAETKIDLRREFEPAPEHDIATALDFKLHDR